MAGTFPKSLRAVAATSMLGQTPENIKNKLLSKYLSHDVLDPLRYFWVLTLTDEPAWEASKQVFFSSLRH